LRGESEQRSAQALTAARIFVIVCVGGGGSQWDKISTLLILTRRGCPPPSAGDLSETQLPRPPGSSPQSVWRMPPAASLGCEDLWSALNKAASAGNDEVMRVHRQRTDRMPAFKYYLQAGGNRRHHRLRQNRAGPRRT